MSEPSPRSGLSPAAWSAVAAIVVALIGGVVTLTTNWWSRPHDKPAAEAASASAAPASAAPAAAAPAAAAPGTDPASWAGTWSGSARAPNEAPFDITVTIAPGCALNGPCGQIRVPNCAGRLTLIEVRDEGAEFRVDDFAAGSDPKICQPGAGEVLTAQPDGTLAYTATYSGARGVLKRQG